MAVGDIVGHRAPEQEGLLQDEADPRRALCGAETADVAAIEIDRPGARIVEPGHQHGRGGLAAAGGAHQRVGLTPLQRQADVLQHPGAVGVGEGDPVEDHDGAGLARGSPGDLDQIVLQGQHVGHPIESGHRLLQAGPHRRQLPKRVIEGGDVEQIADQQADAQQVAPDQPDAEAQHQDLRRAAGQGEERSQDARGYPRRDRGFEVVLVGRAELLLEIVAAVEGDDGLEIGQALLDLAAEAAQAFQAPAAPRLDPGRDQSGDDQHRQGGNEGRDPQSPVEDQQQQARSEDEEEAPEELHQRLREELIDLVGVVVHPRDQVALAVLREEADRQLRQLGEKLVAQLEQQVAPHRAHAEGLAVVGDQPGEIDGGEQPGVAEQQAEVVAPHRAVDRPGDDHRPQQVGGGGDHDADESHGD